MMSLAVVFWMYVILFAVIGGMRGWAKEILVSFSVILALAFTALLEHYVPFIRDVLVPQKSAILFWLRTHHPESCWSSSVIKRLISHAFRPR